MASQGRIMVQLVGGGNGTDQKVRKIPKNCWESPRKRESECKMAEGGLKTVWKKENIKAKASRDDLVKDLQ